MDTVIPHPPWSGLGKRLESLMRKAIFDYKMLEGVSGVAVALSGGKDSLTLLYLLKALMGHGLPAINLYAIHVSGIFTCGAGVKVDYLEEVCGKLGVPLLLRESTQKLETLECYGCSRERRRLLFEAAESVGVTTVAFGHHADDNAQTLLMNVLHKGEFEGMLPKIAMERYGITIIRPLIYMSEADIITFARQYNYVRVTCGCPVGENAMRRRTNEMLKEMEKLFPNARKNLSFAALHYGTGKAGKPLLGGIHKDDTIAAEVIHD